MPRRGGRARRALGVLALALPLVLVSPDAGATPPVPLPSTAVAPAEAAGPPASAPRAGEELVVQVLTFGPGDHPFLKFGHDALRIVGADGDGDEVYNFGTFAFGEPPAQLIKDFLARRLLYWLSRNSMAATSAVYRAENRTIRAQTLALDAATARGLLERLRENALPENRAYAYDYFFDNCATRVRDSVDKAVGGALHAVSLGPAKMSFRDHALRLTADDLPVYLGLSVILGPKTDEPIDRWREMFLPEIVAETLLDVRVVGTDGTSQPLVSRDEMLATARREPSRAWAPDRRGWALFFGVLAGLLGALLVGRSVASVRVLLPAALDEREERLPPTFGVRVVRVLAGLYLAAWGLLAGGLGAALALAWFGTPHLVAHGNQNLFLFAPVALLLLPFGLIGACGVRWAWIAGRVVLALGIVSALGVALAKALHLVPFQQNGLWIAFALPVWLGLAAGAWWPDRKRTSRESRLTGRAAASI